MSSGRVLKDLTDLVDAVARELKVQDEDTVERERIAEDINDLLHDIASRKRWLWLQGHVDIQFKPYYGAGTVSVTPDSTTITFSTSPSSALGSFAGRFFSVEGFSEIYIVDTHTAGSTSATLKSAYTGALNTAATFKVWTDQVALPTDCRETVEVWHDFSNEPMEPIGHQELRKRQAESSKVQARPLFYTTYDFVDPTPGTDETESDRYRVMKVHPAIYSDSTTIHIDYVKEVSALVDDGDEPPMPMEDRIVLVYGARMMAWMRQRNPEASEMNRQRYEDKLARMMGKVEEGVDKPQLTPDSLYIARKRGNRLKSLRGANSSAGSGGSYTSPTYIAGATINGANVSGNITVNSGITIDGRDISADGAALDSHLNSSSAHTAANIVNVPSGNLAAASVQGALNELQTDVDARATAADLTAHINDTTDAHAAAAITNTPSGNLAATTVQGALNEIQTELDTATAHISDATDAHAATAITNTPSGNLAATTVQAALNEIQTELDTATAHISDATDAHAASAITNTPSGNLAATTVQAALNELQTDVDGRQARSTLTTKGDIYAATASATTTRLAVGTNGFRLAADSGETTGLKWVQTYPTVQIFTSGSGTYTTPAGVRWIRVRMVAGGGGGAGSGTASGSAAGNGGNSTFGSSLLTANGGVAGAYRGDGGLGGTSSVSSPAIEVLTIRGGDGQAASEHGSGTILTKIGGASGGSSFFGGAGSGGANGGTGVGVAGKSNTGGGGGGGLVQSTSSLCGGSGGGAGSYLEAIIADPDSTYAYAVGAGGTAGGAGTSGFAGATGGSGLIVVEEYY